MKDKEEKIALFRYGIIAPVIHGNYQAEYFLEMEKKGKIELFNRTNRQIFMPNADFSDIEVLNKCFSNWVEKEYNKSIHSTTKQTPMERFISDIENIKIRRIPENEIHQLFLQRIERKVKKDSTVSIN